MNERTLSTSKIFSDSHPNGCRAIFLDRELIGWAVKPEKSGGWELHIGYEHPDYIRNASPDATATTLAGLYAEIPSDF